MDALFQRNFEVLAALARHRARCGCPAPCSGSSGTVRLCQDHAALLSVLARCPVSWRGFSLLFVYFKEILYSSESVFSFFVHSTLHIIGNFAEHSWELFSGAELSVVSALRVCILCRHTNQGSQEKDCFFYYQEGVGFSDPWKQPWANWSHMGMSGNSWLCAAADPGLSRGPAVEQSGAGRCQQGAGGRRLQLLLGASGQAHHRLPGAQSAGLGHPTSHQRSQHCHCPGWRLSGHV